MSDTFDWPFFTDAHRTLATDLRAWAQRQLTDAHANADVDGECRALVKQLGTAGWLRYTVPAEYGGVLERLDVRSLCIARETLARISGLADFAFAMQGLGAGPISLFGSPELTAKYLPRVASGSRVCACSRCRRVRTWGS